MPEGIWYEDPRGFIGRDTFARVVPLAGQSYAEQLNAVLRLSLYYGVLIAVLRRNYDMLLIPMGVAGLTWLLYTSFHRKGARSSTVEPWQDEGCVRPTRSNPFMNVLASDERTREPACDPLDPVVKQSVDDSFRRSIFYDVDDVWARNNAGRNFYTTPATAVPNDQTGFAEWLYSGVRAGGKQTRPPRNALY